MSNLKLVLNEALPADLYQALSKAAREDDMTVNDAANKILTDLFKIEWEPSGFSYRPIASRFKLRVTDELHKELRIQAAQKMFTIRGLVLSTLAKHFHTTAISPHRRPRKKEVS